VWPHVGEACGDVRPSNQHLPVIAPDELGHGSLVGTLVVLGILEGDGEGRELLPLHLPPHCSDDGAVEAPGEVASHRDVRTQHAQPHGILQRLPDTIHRLRE